METMKIKKNKQYGMRSDSKPIRAYSDLHSASKNGFIDAAGVNYTKLFRRFEMIGFDLQKSS